MFRRIRIQPRFFVFIIAAMVLSFGVSFACAQHSLNEGEKALQAAEYMRDTLELELAELDEQLTYTMSDEYIIRTARDELGMILPGEIRYMSSNS